MKASSPEPITCRTSPSKEETTMRLWLVSAMNSLPPASSARTLPGKLRALSGPRGGVVGRGERRMMPSSSNSATMPPNSWSNCSKVSSPSCLPMTLPRGSMNIRVGQARQEYCCQTRNSASLITGCSSSHRRTAAVRLSVSFSVGNLAEWTPTTTSSLAYLRSSFRNCGKMCMQLTQQ